MHLLSDLSKYFHEQTWKKLQEVPGGDILLSVPLLVVQATLMRVLAATLMRVLEVTLMRVLDATLMRVLDATLMRVLDVTLMRVLGLTWFCSFNHPSHLTLPK